MQKASSKEAIDNLIDLDGTSLTPESIWLIVNSPKIKVTVRKNISQILAAHSFLCKSAEKKIIYGVNTGFGPMASRIISKEKLRELQKNLIRSHASGAGEPLREDFVLAAMIVRLNTLSKGVSGVSLALISHLISFINHRIIPVVPEHGAVGTSGDLVQLAHIALALIGEGEVFYKGKRLPTKKVLRQLNITPYTLQIKEGISLINGTAMMSGIASILLHDAEKISTASLQLGAFSLEIIGAYDDSIAKELHKLRPHAGQFSAAKSIREFLKDSKRLHCRYDSKSNNTDINSTTYALPRAIQDVYSFRCIPQIIGPLLETVVHARRVIAIEINSATDNPLIDIKKGKFLHGGNFHGDYIATIIDQLKIPLIKASLLSERRINYLLDEKINGSFPPFLNLNTPGLTLALQGLQFVATSTAAQNQTFAFPHSIHTISTNGSNQDVVSMGTDAALFLSKIIDNIYIIFAIELINLLQAFDITHDYKNFSTTAKVFYKKARMVSPQIKEDRSLTPDINSLIHLLKNNV